MQDASRDEGPQFALPLVIRVERATPPARTDALEGAARAVLRFLSDPRVTEPDGEWAAAARDWEDARIRKVVRRARGAAWERASALPGITVTHRSAEVRVYPPVPVDEWPADLARLQVSGTDLEDPRAPGAPAATTPVLWLNPELPMTAGKAMAQAGHGAQLAWWGLSPRTRSEWLDLDFDLAVRTAAKERWADLLASGLPVVTDGGFTEVAPGSATVVADHPALRAVLGTSRLVWRHFSPATRGFSRYTARKMRPTPLRMWRAANMGAQRAGAPVLTGSVPPLAHFFHARQETGFDLADALRPGETVLLVPALLGTGGTGKTQLAIGFAHAMWSARAVDLLAWVPAGNRSAIIAGYAQAAADLRLLGDEEPPADAAARRFLDWLRTTERRWAVVLDGVASPVDIDELWPRGPAGQVVVTSRLRESELAWSGAGVSAHAVGGFSRREALAYLNTRLTAFPDQRIEALDLAEDLGGLPVALAQAAAVVTVAGSTCRDYRAAYEERLRTTTETLVEGCPPSMLATWSIAVEHAHELPPGGLSWPALVFAAALDTSGIPAAVLTSPAACGYITGRTGTGGAGPHRRHRHRWRGPGGRRREPGAVRLRHLGAARPGQRRPRQRGAHRLAAHGGALRGARLPGAWQRRAGGGRGGRGAARGLAGACRPGERAAAQPGAARLRRRPAHLRGRPAVEAGGAPGAAAGGDVAHGGPGPHRGRDRVLAGAQRREQPAARVRARPVGARQGPARRRLRGQRARRRGAARLRGGARRPRGDLRAAAPGDGHHPAERGEVAERRRARARGDRAVRAGARGAGSGRAGPATGRRWRCGYSSPPRTRRRAGAATASSCTSGRSPRPSGNSARPTGTRWPPGSAWRART